MPIFSINNKNVLFIHIPKTGGTSIENWLSNFSEMQFYQPAIPSFMKCTPQHLTIGNLKTLFGEHFYDEGLKSEFIYRTKLQKATYKTRPDFSDWIITNLKKAGGNKHYFDNHLRPQIDFIDETINTFKLENGLKNVTQFLSNKLKIKSDIRIPRLNSQRNKKKLKFTNEALNMVNQFYKNDFKLLDYKMEELKINLN